MKRKCECYPQIVWNFYLQNLQKLQKLIYLLLKVFLRESNRKVTGVRKSEFLVIIV